MFVPTGASELPGDMFCTERLRIWHGQAAICGTLMISGLPPPSTHLSAVTRGGEGTSIHFSGDHSRDLFFLVTRARQNPSCECGECQTFYAVSCEKDNHTAHVVAPPAK